MIAVSPAVARGWGSTLKAYFLLTKPRIIELLLVTTLPTMVLAEGGMPSPLLVLVTLIGGSIAAGGANAINCYVDRDIDRLMYRTRGRPLPAGNVTPQRALAFGITLGVISFVGLAVFANLLAASLSLGALLFYVFVYTLWLKRSTPQNIVIGGAAGAAPPLVGWAAVTGDVGLPALVLFAIVFFWTPPHFWALALRFKEDYARANVPMLPVLKGDHETQKQILVYAVLLVPVTVALAFTGAVGPTYLVLALVLDALFVHRALALWRGYSARRASDLFRFSIVYLAAIFAALIADVVFRALTDTRTLF